MKSSVIDDSSCTPVFHAAPELPAYDTGRNLIVWCDHCHVWHAHGRGYHGGSEGDGHRVAHCHKPNSPYSRSGYIIRYVGPATPDMLKDLQRRRQRGTQNPATAYAILELGTGYMDGWYYTPLDEVQDIARWLDEVRPKYRHRVIAQVEPFSMRAPVVFLADAMRGDKEARP